MLGIDKIATDYMYRCENCFSRDEANYELVYGEDDGIVLCRRCLLKLKRQIDDVVEKR